MGNLEVDTHNLVMGWPAIIWWDGLHVYDGTTCMQGWLWCTARNMLIWTMDSLCTISIFH